MSVLPCYLLSLFVEYPGLVSSKMASDTQYTYTVLSDVMPGRKMPKCFLDAKLCGGVGQSKGDASSKVEEGQVGHDWMLGKADVPSLVLLPVCLLPRPPSE